jgi:flavin-dependent dehydrogenase
MVRLAADLRCDICVVGGGPAGAVAACVLAGAGARVALLVRNRRDAALAIGETVPAELKPLLGRLGLDCLTPERHVPSAGTMARWGSDIIGFREAILSPYGCGWHLDRGLFERQLLEFAIEKGVTAVENCGRLEAKATPSAWRFQVERAGRRIGVAANYLVDCTGRSACLAIAAGARRRICDKLIAIWSVAEQRNGRHDPDQRIYLESAPDGWLYSAQLPNRRRVIAYFTDGDLGNVSWAMSASAFEAFVADRFQLHAVTGGLRYSIVTGPVRVNAASTRLVRAYGERWVAAGDAAQSFDPLSSQGIMLAVVGGNNAAAALIAAHSADRSALEKLQADLDGRYAAYLGERQVYYRAEQRWKERPFWRRRHNDLPPGSQASPAGPGTPNRL